MGRLSASVIPPAEAKKFTVYRVELHTEVRKWAFSEDAKVEVFVGFGDSEDSAEYNAKELRQARGTVVRRLVFSMEGEWNVA